MWLIRFLSGLLCIWFYISSCHFIFLFFLQGKFPIAFCFLDRGCFRNLVLIGGLVVVWLFRSTAHSHELLFVIILVLRHWNWDCIWFHGTCSCLQLCCKWATVGYCRLWNCSLRPSIVGLFAVLFISVSYHAFLLLFYLNSFPFITFLFWWVLWEICFLLLTHSPGCLDTVTSIFRFNIFQVTGGFSARKWMQCLSKMLAILQYSVH